MEQVPKSPLRENTILIVDDDKFFLNFIHLVLKKQGYQVLTGNNGKEGLAILEKKTPDLIISDVMMPEMNGIEFCKAVKANPKTKDVYFLVLTSKSEISEKIRLLDIGADDFLSKPVNNDELLAKVRASMRIRDLQRELKESNQRLTQLNTQLQQTTQYLQKANREIKEAQSQLLQHEKMASIGQLAAGVAHEINNPIGFIYSNLSVLQDYIADLLSFFQRYRALKKAVQTGRMETVLSAFKELEKAEKEIDLDFIMDDFEKIVRESLDGAERVKVIVQDLKDFSHIDQAEVKYFNLNQGLESTLNIVWNEIKYKAKVIKEYGDIPEVRCYPMQLNQVFMNLLVNAAQAIEKNGLIKIKTFAKKNRIYVQITDNGCGIPKKNLHRIFDPFFTTKEVGKGTGLGLSTAYNIIKKHNGEIRVESKVGKGTRFTIELPIEAVPEKEEAEQMLKK
ncbi:MAG: response regulator [Calditrichaeota bacterium]|nr:response regulator [Calditrichota bacterium]